MQSRTLTINHIVQRFGLTFPPWYNLLARKYFLREVWNYEASKEFPPQRFGLSRTLELGEVPTVPIKDDEFNMQFSLTYYHVNSKSKNKEISKIIKEVGVNIIFKNKESNPADISVPKNNKNRKIKLRSANGIEVKIETKVEVKVQDKKMNPLPRQIIIQKMLYACKVH